MTTFLHPAQSKEYGEPPVFDNQIMVERHANDLDNAVDDLIADFNGNAIYVMQNREFIARSAEKLNFLLSALSISEAAE